MHGHSPHHVRRAASSLWFLLSGLILLSAVSLVPRPAGAQGCQQVGCDQVPPVVTPSFDAALLPLDTMRITWCDNEWLMPATRTITLNGTNVVGGFTYNSASGSCASRAMSVGTATLNPGTTYTLIATIQDEHGNIGTGSVEYTTPNGWIVVNPKGLSISKPQQSTNLSQAFVVKNPSPTANNYRLVRTCLGNVSSCSAVPDTVHLNGGDSTTVSVTYNTGLISSGSTGTIRLRARMTTDTTIADSSDVAITLITSLIVDDSPNNNDAQNMRLCAYSCFANIYSHSTVPYFSLDQPRGVTLIYNHIRTWERPYLLFNISNVAGSPTVTKLKMVVRDSTTGSLIRVQGDNSGGAEGTVYFWRGTGSVRIGTHINDGSWLLAHGTGIHQVRVVITAERTGLADEIDTVFVPVLIVRDPPGAVARGWYVEGVQRLIPTSGSRVIVTEADGSAFVFTATDTLGSYQAPAGEYSRLSKSGGVYTRAYSDSSKVRFDSLGKMLDVSDSWGKKIRYAYDASGRPTRIYDPFRTRPDSTAAPSAYTELVYYADSVLLRPPQADGSSYDASRVTRLRLTSDSLLRAVVDPDRDSTRFWYEGNVMPSPHNNRQLYLDSVYNRNATRQAYFKYDRSFSDYVGSMRLNYANGPSIPTYNCCGNTTNSNPSATLYDWRGRGVSAWATSSGSPGSPARLDTLYSEVRDPGSHSTFSMHDRWGQFLKVITHNKKDTTTISRTGLFADSVRNPIGTVDRFTYTTVAGGRPALLASYPAGRPSTSYTYDALGQVDSIVGLTLTRIKRLNANPAYIDSIITKGYPTKFEYDSWGRLIRRTDPSGHKVEVFFDDVFGNTRKTLEEGNRFDAVEFDAYGRDSILTSTVAATRFVKYDSLNRVRRDSVAGATGATVYTYDKLYVVRVVDPKGQIFKREVNALGWTRKVFDPADTTKYDLFNYFVEGLPAHFVNRRGQWKELYYNANDNRHFVTSTNADNNVHFNRATYSFAYRDSAGRRIGTVLVGANNHATDSILSDTLGRLQTVITRVTANRSSGVNDALGQRRYIRKYAWNSDGLLDSVSLETRQAGSGTLIRSFSTRKYKWNSTTRALDTIKVTGISANAHVKRDAEGKDSTWNFPSYYETVNATSRHEAWTQWYSSFYIDSVLRRSYAFTDTIAGRVKSILFGMNNSLVQSFRYTPQGDLSWVKDLTNGQQCSEPDPGVTLVDGFNCTPAGATTARTLGLEYDAARNLRKQVDSVASVTDTAVVAAGNRLTSWGARSYTYDLDGNMITRTSGGTTTTFSYDGEGMLRRTIVGTDTTCYEYNAFNQLIYKGTGCGSNVGPGTSPRKATRIYVWDRDQIIAEVDSLASTRFAEYVYRPGIDRPHALLSDSAGSTIARFYVQDRLGNVIGVTQGDAPAQTLTYDPWGELKASTGTLADTSRLRWKGLYWEGGNTKLYYVRNRWYDPEARRFTSQDPIGIDGGLNLYTFAGNDWINGADPFGLHMEQIPDTNRSSGTNPDPSDRGRDRGGSQGAGSAGGSDNPKRPGSSALGRLLNACTGSIADVGLDVVGGVSFLWGGVAVGAARLAARQAGVKAAQAAARRSVPMKYKRRLFTKWGQKQGEFAEQWGGFLGGYGMGVQDDVMLGGGLESLIPFLGLKDSFPEMLASC